MRSISRKRAAKMRAEAGPRREFLKGRQCALLAMPGHRCFGGMSVHEPWSRGRGGPTDDLRNWLAVCFEGNRMLSQDADTMQWGLEHGMLVRAADGARWLEAGGVNQ